MVVDHLPGRTVCTALLKQVRTTTLSVDLHLLGTYLEPIGSLRSPTLPSGNQAEAHKDRWRLHKYILMLGIAFRNAVGTSITPIDDPYAARIANTQRNDPMSRFGV